MKTRAPDSVLRLIENFDNHIDHYKSTGYNETELRREFLDPFFKALGWDIDNQQGYADAYKDVIHEDAIKIGGSTKAPDYCFRIGGQRKYFLEAKKPSVNIKGDVAPAYQLRRYAWSAKLPLSILSDFEELAVYDCRIKPVKTDKSSTARVLYYTFDQYEDKWEEISAIFSREAILKGSFDKYAESSKKKRGTTEVDDAFLLEIERWREQLARNFALRNPSLSIRDLNFAVQKNIDRLIFLRICEDRGSEDYGRLKALQKGSDTYQRLIELYVAADDRYNSGLFHFSEEKNRPGAPDALTTGLKLDDKIIKGIVKNLYYPDSPYEFSVLPADILGQVYEQFLGKTICLTSAHKAKIEDKPEVRKAGGVYYTPKYIVDYIVENTLGNLLNGNDSVKSKPIAVSQAEKIKILDPACGSGSFLIVAYQYLLDWHRDQYTLVHDTGELDNGKIKRHAGGKNPKIYQAPGGEYRLTTAERKRILLNNIHGVDIDSQAVEVSKLSLLLKVLEGETLQTLQRDFIAERERILPDLGNNIKCGNSLISSDFYEIEQMLLLDEDLQYRINVFDWQEAFPNIMKEGGFNCVIGNPPYGIPLTLPEQEYLAINYPQTGKLRDSYSIFMVAAASLAKNGGVMSYIVPNTFCDLESGIDFRQWLLNNIHLEKLWQTGWAFNQAIVDTLVFVARVEPAGTSAKVAIEIPSDSFQIDIQDFRDNHLQKIDFRNRPESKHIFNNVSHASEPLSEFLTVKAGVKLYEKGKGKPPQTPEVIKDRIFTQKDSCPEGWLPLLRGGHINRYKIDVTNEFVRYGEWLAAPRKPEMFFEHKLIMRRTDDRLLTAYDDTGLVCVNSCHIIQFKSDDLLYKYQYFLGLLNSRLMQYVFKLGNSQMVGKVFSEIKVIYVKRLPIYPIDFDNSDDVKKYEKIIELVDSMHNLQKKRVAEKNPETLRHLDTQVATTDHQIDYLVYDLYGLTDEEITVVEKSVA